jgi:hypothetical protein
MTGTSAPEEADGKLLATGWVIGIRYQAGTNIYSVRHQQPWDLPIMLCSVYRRIFYWFFDFLCALTKLRKATFSYVMSVRLSGWNTSAPTRRIFVKCDILNINVGRIKKLVKITTN